MIFTGLLILASKSSTRWGDGPAQIALWKYWLPVFWETGHVSNGKNCNGEDFGDDNLDDDDYGGDDCVSDDDEDCIDNDRDLYYQDGEDCVDDEDDRYLLGEVRHRLYPEEHRCLRRHGPQGGRGRHLQQLCEHTRFIK